MEKLLIRYGMNKMLPFPHIFFGFIFSFILKIFLKLNLYNFLFLFFCTWVFDVDHYLFYVLKKKDLNFFHAYDYFIKKKNLRLEERRRLMLLNNRIFIFHTLEIIFLIFILIFVFSKLHGFLFLLGNIFHLFLDVIESFKDGFIKERYSLILFFISKKNLKIKKVKTKLRD